jgi:hypothetical protein
VISRDNYHVGDAPLIFGILIAITIVVYQQFHHVTYEADGWLAVLYPFLIEFVAALILFTWERYRALPRPTGNVGDAPMSPEKQICVMWLTCMSATCFVVVLVLVLLTHC